MHSNQLHYKPQKYPLGPDRIQIGVFVFMEGWNRLVRQSKLSCNWGNQRLSPFGFYCLVTLQSLDFKTLNYFFLLKPAHQIYFLFHKTLMLRACSNNKAGFLRTEMTPLASEITLHTKYDGTYRLFRVQSGHNSTILVSKICQYKHGDFFFDKAHGRYPGSGRQNVGKQWELHLMSK